MRKKFFFLLFFVSTLVVDAKDFSVASYNVENLFDLQKDGTEYEEYTPNTKLWNKTSLNKKLDNIAQVLRDLDADIVALQEIETQKALENLLHRVPNYKYYKFIKKETSSVGVALISKFPIMKSSAIDVDKFDKNSRDILKATVLIDQKEFIIYVNHWRSKRAVESKRIIYATALNKDIKSLPKNKDYIIAGDLNSNYNEYHTFKFDNNLNDTSGITGINQILNTTIEQNFVKKATMCEYPQKVHYNLWFELKTKDRFSSIYKMEQQTPDNILLPRALFDKKGISYIDKSFYVFNPPYLYKGDYLNRWNIYKAQGYSDHLPIVAKFSTSLQNYDFVTQQKLQVIDTLYNFEQISDFDLEEIVVIYKNKKIAIVKHLDQTLSQRAIVIFNPPAELEVGGVYNFTVEALEVYNGLKEIKTISNIEKLKKIKEYTQYYTDGNMIDLFAYEYQNFIITNLKGIYKKGYLHYPKNKQFSRIKVYFKKDIKRPKDGDRLSIKSGHLGIYKTKVQIVLHSVKDYTVN